MRPLDALRSCRFRRARPLALAAWIVLAICALVLFWASVTTMVAFYHVDLFPAFVAATVQCGSLALAVVLPKIATVLQLGAVIGIGFAAAGEVSRPWPTPVVALIVLCAFLCIVGLRQRWIFSVALWWLSFSTLVIVIVFNPEQVSDTERWGYNLLVDATVTLLVLGGSVGLGQRRRIRVQLAEARRDVELEQARRRYGEERSRIARELHDVVAHSMSIVHIQATSAKFRIEGLDPVAVDEFDDIARSARTALREMRQLLGALRPEDDGAERSPQAQLGDIQTLIIGARRVGTETEVTLPSDEAELTPVVQLTLYRIVQEALSNAVRHAPRAETAVAITTGRDSVTVVVQNVAAPVLAERSSMTTDRGGMGLRGMRERVALLGGTLNHGPTADGGFRVVATLPIDGDRAVDLGEQLKAL